MTMSSGSDSATTAARTPLMAWPSVWRAASACCWPPLTAASRRPALIAVEPGSPEAELAENVDEAHCLTLRASSNEVSDLAGQTAGASPDLGVAHDRAAHAVVEVDVGEVAQGPRGRAVPFRPGGPVHVVVHGDRSFDVRGENLDRVKLAEQERGIGQLDQPPGAPVYRVSGAHDRQPRRPTAALLGTDDRGAQRGGYLIGVRPADVLFRSGHRVAEGVKAFGHDSFRRDAQGNGDSDVGQGVVRAHPATATATQSPLARVRHEASLGQPAYALPDGRL